MEERRLNRLSRPLTLVAELLRGEELDNRRVMAVLGIKKGNAGRHLKALQNLPGVQRVQRDNRTVLKFDRGRLGKSLPVSAALASCFGACLAPLFEGTNYAGALRDARDHMVAQVARRDGFKELDRKFLFLHRGGEAALPDRAEELDDLIEALLAEKVVVLSYVNFQGKTTRPQVEPLSLVVHEHQLYLLGRREDGSLRPYRFARIASVTVQGRSFEYPTRAEFDPSQVFSASFGVFLQDEQPIEKIEILLDAEWKNYVLKHRWHGSQRVRKDPRGALLSLQVKVCPELKQWVLGFGRSAEVLAPPSFRAEIARELEGGANRYRCG